MELVARLDRWDASRPGAWKGYQRGVIKEKVNNLADYLERDDAVMPIAGLLNVRDVRSISFTARDRTTPTSGTLTIDEGARLWVVDMQHRLEGLKKAADKGYFRVPVPLVIASGLAPIDEAAQFYLINTKSRRMGVDLTKRLLIEHGRIADLSDVKEWEMDAVRITIKLNRRMAAGNPWFGRIREPNTISTGQPATEKSFVPSLAWLLRPADMQGHSPQRTAEFLADFWEAIREQIPDAFGEPKRYLIQKTHGYMAFHRLAPILYRKTRNMSRDARRRKLKRSFAPLARLGAAFWKTTNRRGAKRFGTGQGGYANLAQFLHEQLGLS